MIICDDLGAVLMESAYNDGYPFSAVDLYNGYEIEIRVTGISENDFAQAEVYSVSAIDTGTLDDIPAHVITDLKEMGCQILKDPNWELNYLMGEVPPKAAIVYQQAFAPYADSDNPYFSLIALLGTKALNDGTGYAFLCKSTPGLQGDSRGLVISTVYEDSDGNCDVTGLYELNLDRLFSGKHQNRSFASKWEPYAPSTQTFLWPDKGIPFSTWDRVALAYLGMNNRYSQESYDMYGSDIFAAIYPDPLQVVFISYENDKPVITTVDIKIDDFLGKNYFFHYPQSDSAKEFVFNYKGNEIFMGMPEDEVKKLDGYELSYQGGTADCNVYTFDGFEIWCKYDPLIQNPIFADTIHFLDKSVETAEGIRIGDPIEKALSIYKNETLYMSSDVYYSFLKGNSILSFSYKDGIITEIYYFYWQTDPIRYDTEYHAG